MSIQSRRQIPVILLFLSCFLSPFVTQAADLLPAETLIPEAIDHSVRRRLQEEQIKAAKPADDSTLLRRLTLDLAGRIPTAAEARDYTATQDPQKRDALVARLLASEYGHTLDPVVYTQGVGVSGRLRLARLVDSLEETSAEVVRLVEPLVAARSGIVDNGADGASLAGLVWCDELSEATGDTSYAAALVDDPFDSPFVHSTQTSGQSH
jgi:hypothetical protein